MYQFNVSINKVINDSLMLKNKMQGGVLAIGNFDGLHKGHQYILTQALIIAKRNIVKKVPFGALTFSPHPQIFLNPNNNFFKLNSNDIRKSIFEQLNIDLLVILEFNKQFASFTAEEFILKILVKLLKISYIIIGKDFCFGKKRKGNANYLKKMGIKYGFGVSILMQIKNNNIVISSSNIRKALCKGNIEEANSLLGYNWYIEGIVETGQQLGRMIGFPTINIKTYQYCDLKHGTYAVTIDFNGYFYYGAANFGLRPTINGNSIRFEIYIFNFNNNIYGKKVRIFLHKFIRKDKKFNNLNELIIGINNDIKKIKQYFTQNLVQTNLIEELKIL